MVYNIYDKLKALIESKDFKIYFCNIFIICLLLYVFKSIIILAEIKFFMLNTKFCYQNGFLPFN